MRKAVQYLLGVLSIFVFATVLDNTLVASFHESGHLLAASALDVKILKIEFSILTGWKIYFLPTGDWRTNIMGYFGGLFACVMLAILYMGASKGFRWLGNRTRNSQKRSQQIDILSFFLLNAMVADLMFEFVIGLIEGTNLGFYQMIVSNPVLSIIAFSVMMVVFASISLLIWIREG